MVHLLLAQVRHSARAREALGAFLADDPLALEGAGSVKDTPISPPGEWPSQTAKDFGLAEQKMSRTVRPLGS